MEFGENIAINNGIIKKCGFGFQPLYPFVVVFFVWLK
jgi:hypothetical protein